MIEVYTVPLTGPQDAGKFLIYRPIAGLAFIGNRAMAALAMRAADGAWSEDQEPAASAGAVAFLRDIGYLEHTGAANQTRIIGQNPLAAPLPPAAPSTHYRSLALLLTNQCSLRCTYCYAAAGDLPAQELSEEHARSAIDYLVDQAAAAGLPEVVISFHGGGEPTFAWRLLQNLTRYARAKPLKTVISLTTNGVWSERQREWIFANVDRIGISMDGMPGTQDRQRPLRSGGPSSPVVMRNLAEMDRRGIMYGVRVTATAPWKHLPDDVEFICQETGAQAIQVEPAFNTERGQHQEPPESEWRAFGDAFLEARDIARSHRKKLHYSGARAGQVMEVFCTAPYDALVVAPGGRLVACYEVTSETHPLSSISLFGSIADGQVRVDQAARENLHRRMAERRASCRDCFCYWSCAGDCYVQAFDSGEQGHLTKTARCELNRYITEQILLDMIAQGDGYWSVRMDSSLAPAPPISPWEEELYGD